MLNQLNTAVSAADHSQGDTGSAVTIVEYGDFECPDCSDAHLVIEQIKKKFGQQVRFVFRNFPLLEIHRYAMAAAMAAEAAGRQKYYWEMYDLLFEHQDQMDEEIFIRLARQLSLNLPQFVQDTQSAALQHKIAADFDSGIKSGVNGTPTFFVNGKKFDGGADNLLEMLEESTV
jgi:protein-disulfide isomerase